MLVNTQFTYKKTLFVLLSCFALVATGSLTGCGGSAGDAPKGSGSSSGSETGSGSGSGTGSGSGSGTGSGSGGGTGGTVAATPGTANVALSSTSLTAAAPIAVTATIKNADGTVVANEVVTFSVPDTYGSFNASSAQTSLTALTNASGVATALLYAGTVSGAATVTATSEAKDSTSKEGTISGRSSFAVTAAGQAVNTITMGTLSTGVSSLSAYGTTSATVTVMNNGAVYLTPVEVSFNSVCAGTGKATLTSKVTTINGTATAAYVDKGCNSTDAISATVTGVTATPATANLTVASPAIGSIRFVSASPENISLKGTGGAGRQETSLVTFKVVDEAGKPIAAKVKFALDTTLGGLKLSSDSATSDATTGLVSTYVQAGTVHTPVTVTATYTNGTRTITTQSSELSLSTGIPAQGGFSLSTTSCNLNGLKYDGETATLTIRSTDQLGVFSPKGTTVNFVAEGGGIAPSCTLDEQGTCSVTFRTQNSRPADGRVTVLAYAVGEESFVDNNSNGFMDPLESFVDVPEAFLDGNGNNVRDSGERFFDFDGNGAYSPIDGKYSGVLCQGTQCSVRKNMHVFADTGFVFSDDEPNLGNTRSVSSGLENSYNLGGCSALNSYSVNMVLADLNGNPLPAGTKVNISTDNGTVSGSISTTLAGCGYTTIPFTLKNNLKLGASCEDATSLGDLKIEVTVPARKDGAAEKTTTWLIPVVN